MKRAVVEEIKARLPLIDLIAGYIPLEKAGKNFRAKCPFHSEKTASFYISQERDSYYCFGCGKKGDIFTFIEEYEGLDFKQALKNLADRTGVTIDESSLKSDNQTKDKKEKLYSVLESATHFFEKEILKSENAMSYLKKRGLQKGTIDTYRVGYAPKEWKSLVNYLKNYSFTDEDMEDAGLIKKGDYGYYDRFRDRIMFPFTDTSGRVIGFSGRILSEDSKEAKYVNSPETLVFNKGSIFFGMNQAKEAIRHKKAVLIVEGQMDVCMVYQSGIKYVIGSSGTAFSGDLENSNKASHLGIIKRFTDTLYFCFDNDSAGLKAMYRAVKESLENNFSTYCISISEGKDPADSILKDPQSFKKSIEDKKPAIIFFVEKLLDKNNTQLILKGLPQRIWPLINILNSPLEESHILTNISKMTGISENVLIDDLKTYKGKIVNTTYSKMDNNNLSEIINISKQDYKSLQYLFGVVYFLGEEDIFSQELLNKLKEIIGEKEFIDIRKDHEKNKEELLFYIEKVYSTKDILVKDSLFRIKQFRKEFYEEKLKILKKELEDGIPNQEQNEKILKQVVDITHKLKNIHHEESNI